MPSLLYLPSYRDHIRSILIAKQTKQTIQTPTQNNLVLSIKNNTIHVIYDSGCYENRHSSILKLFQDASQTYNLPDIPSLTIDSNDYTDSTNYIKFGFSHSQWDMSTIMIPCWGFDHWKSTGLNSYQEFYNDLQHQMQPWETRKNQMLWAGNIDTHFSRREYFATHQHDPFYDLRPMQWIGSVPKDHEFYTRQSSNFTLLSEYTKYKYALDIQGNGYSARVKYLLLTGAVLCYVQRPFVNEFYFNEFIPGKDYILNKVDPTEEQNNKIIQQNGHQKALDLLHYDNIIFNIKCMLDEVHLHHM